MTIPLIGGGEAIVDDDLFPGLKLLPWKLSGGYAVLGFYGMHRAVIGAKKGQIVDHINGNRLDNQRSNLRFCTHSQNQFNRAKKKNCSSRFKGVAWHAPYKKWNAYIEPLGKKINLGYFSNEVEAAKAYNQAALKHGGQFAWLNPV